MVTKQLLLTLPSLGVDGQGGAAPIGYDLKTQNKYNTERCKLERETKPYGRRGLRTAALGAEGGARHQHDLASAIAQSTWHNTMCYAWERKERRGFLICFDEIVPHTQRL